MHADDSGGEVLVNNVRRLLVAKSPLVPVDCMHFRVLKEGLVAVSLETEEAQN
jgi:hypothetical protein